MHVNVGPSGGEKSREAGSPIASASSSDRSTASNAFHEPRVAPRQEAKIAHRHGQRLRHWLSCGSASP
jgi:hypothetical protein